MTFMHLFSARRMVLLVLCGSLAGCISGPTIKDYERMTTVMKAEALRAQMTIADFQTERQALQQELGTTRATQARQTGDLLEAKRRLLEARQVVDLQREELHKAWEERERFAQTSRDAQGQLMELGRLRQQLADAERERTRLEPLETALARLSSEITKLKVALRLPTERGGSSSASAKASGSASAKSPPAKVPSFATPSSTSPLLSAQKMLREERGDTLWSLARRYGVSLGELKAVNGLDSDLILAGQELVLPDSSTQ
jgi:LysM repeat protein